MVTYSNNAEQLAAWHHLYLPHPAEHFIQTRSCDLWQPLFFVNSMCGLAGIKQTVRGQFWWNTKHVLSVFVLCHSFGLRNGNTSSSVAQYIALCKERGTYCSAFISSHMLMLYWFHINLINVWALLCHHQHNNTPINKYDHFVIYSDSLSVMSTWQQLQVCGQNETLKCLLLRCLDI